MALAWIPTRCSDELAFGDSVPDPRVGVDDQHAVADARRGSGVGDRPGYGNEPSAIIAANRSNSDRYSRSSSPAVRPVRSTHSRVSTAIVRPPQRTGMASMRAGSAASSTVTSPSVISPDADD